MTVFTTIAFTTFFLENNHLLTLYKGNEHFTIHFCTFNGRSTDFNVAVGLNKKHLVESDSVTFFHFFAEMMDIKVLTFFSLKLLSFDFYDSVHLLFY